MNTRDRQMDSTDDYYITTSEDTDQRSRWIDHEKVSVGRLVRIG